MGTFENSNKSLQMPKSLQLFSYKNIGILEILTHILTDLTENFNGVVKFKKKKK
jgi:hypothetical protein